MTDDQGSSDVQVNVEIAPREVEPPVTEVVECVTGCTPEPDGLAGTGGDAPTLIGWVAVALIAAGILLVVWRICARRIDRARLLAASQAYHGR